jgi:hypothetical protein
MEILENFRKLFGAGLWGVTTGGAPTPAHVLEWLKEYRLLSLILSLTVCMLFCCFCCCSNRALQVLPASVRIVWRDGSRGHHI